MIALQLIFKRSNEDGYLYVAAPMQRTNFVKYMQSIGAHLGSGYLISSISIKDQIEFLGNSECKEYNGHVYKIKPRYVALSTSTLSILMDSIYNTLSVGTNVHAVIDSKSKVITITFRILEEISSISKNSSMEYVRGKNNVYADIMNIQKSKIDFSKFNGTETKETKKFAAVCKACHQGFEDKDKVKEVALSTGKKVDLCDSCASKIEICGSCQYPEPAYVVRQAIKISDETGQNQKFFICINCSEKVLPRCQHCGYYYMKEHVECPCQVRNDFKGHIEAHNADVLNFYLKDQYSDELFGVEIEAGTLNKNRRMFREIATATKQITDGNAILKYDSSIDWINKQEGLNNDYKGFEIVTRPMVYKNTIRFLKELCKNRHPLLRSWEVATCGLHIHVSKACLSPFEIGKILLFINNKGNRQFIKMIAKREDKRFAKFITKKLLDYRKMTPECHYEAINTSKLHTIEFRIFRGTLNIHTIVSYLQFVKSVIEFVRVTPKDQLTHIKYNEFLFSTEKSRFRELKRRIESENTKEIKEKGEI